MDAMSIVVDDDDDEEEERMVGGDEASADREASDTTNGELCLDGRRRWKKDEAEDGGSSRPADDVSSKRYDGVFMLLSCVCLSVFVWLLHRLLLLGWLSVASSSSTKIMN
jgi:hypothetical protein